MKKLIYLFIAIVLTSCGKFADGTSVWQEGLWAVPCLTGLGAVVCWIQTYREWKKGGHIGYDGNKLVEDDKRFPIYKSAFFVFACALTVATIGIIIWVNAEK